MEVVLGDDTRVRATGVGTISFQRESLPPLNVMEILYVPRLRRNLILVSCIQDRGNVVLFQDGQVLMYLWDLAWHLLE